MDADVNSSLTDITVITVLNIERIKMDKNIEPIRIDEMGIEVCILCDCAVENNTCLCDMRGW
tara:strand:- start:354 stop:539 length:186 start_codon:yes stop_codon:yes gene_type:complete